MGFKGRKHTDDAKRKASASMKKHVEKYGFSKEHRRKLSIANKGKKPSPLALKRALEVNKDRTP